MRAHELWKQINDHPFYLISTHGNVRSIKSGYIKPIKSRKSGSGYLFVTFSYGKIQIHRSVHSLVYAHFIGAVPEGYEINHKDCNKANNYYGNLEPMTHKENVQHGMNNALRVRFESRF